MATYDKAAWGADFERLKRDMAQGYANLDWVAEKRGLDLRQLSARTEEALAGTGSRIRALREIRLFLDAFDDPHLRLEPREEAPAPSPAAAAKAKGPPPSPPAGADCAAAGYDEGDKSFSFPFAGLASWRAVRAQGNFPIGMIGTTGVLRIAAFGEDRYLSACEAAFRPGLTKRALQLETRRLLQVELRQRIAELRQRGAARILVDLTGNGGGTEWV
jgi:hypothetical protein